VIVLLSFAQKAQQDPSFKRYIQRSIGMGLIRRLLS
jgi:hypothetical protein